MKILLQNIVFIVGLFLVVLSGNAQKGTIKGKVRGTEDVLSAATVSLGNKTYMTNSKGEFFITADTGTYILTVTYSGYKKIGQEVKIKAGVIYTYDFTLTPADLLDEVAVLGSLSLTERSSLNTPVPVDVFSEKKILQTTQVGLIQSLNYLVPSLTVEKEILNQPVTYRGLDPVHLLILVNGVRYHNSSWLNNGSPKSDLGSGSVANDLNSIPFSAIEKIELLRDGASAQYGSDAIAGVLNFQLKKITEKTSVNVHTGQFYAGDGLKVSLGLSRGVQINNKGFLNYSAYFRYQEPTTRAGEYQGLVYKKYPTNANHDDSVRTKAEDDSIILARGINKKEFSKFNGNNRLHSLGILLNGGYPIGNSSEFFWTSSVNYRENLHSAGAYRFPNNSNTVNTALHPNGFKAKVNTDNWDIMLIAGIKGDTRNKWHWQLTNSYGSNSNSRYVSNSNNASQYALGKNAPTTFYLGKLFYMQYISSINFTKDLAKKNNNLKSCNISSGVEWRVEKYRQNPGEEASWYNYNTDTTQPNIQGGSQPAIGAISDSNVVNKSRGVLGSYIDFEIEPNDRLLFDLASRYEYYTDFGGNLAGKFAVRYKVSRKSSLRGSISNGFRAPSIQQRFYEGTQTYRGTEKTQGIFSNNSPVTRAFGIPLLQAERSVNLSVGLTSRLSKNISFTIDAYRIQIKNRIVLSGVFDRSKDPDVDAKLKDLPNIGVVQFYANAVNTRTYGIDAVLNGKWNINKTNLGLTLAANFNRNSIFGPIAVTDKISDTSLFAKTLFGTEERTTLEKEKPGEKIILSATANKGKFGFLFRNTFFGNTALTTIQTNTSINTNRADTIYENFSSKIITDFNISYTPKSWLTITVGANNIFDVYPDRLDLRISSNGTALYSNEASPFGFNGRYYFMSMSFNF